LFQLPKNNPVISQGFSCLIHLHTAVEEVVIKQIKGKYDDELSSKINSKIKFLSSNQRGKAIIQVIPSIFSNSCRVKDHFAVKSSKILPRLADSLYVIKIRK